MSTIVLFTDRSLRTHLACSKINHELKILIERFFEQCSKIPFLSLFDRYDHQMVIFFPCRKSNRIVKDDIRQTMIDMKCDYFNEYLDSDTSMRREVVFLYFN